MVQNFLWHKLSEEEKEGIKKESKQIMEDFGASLGKVEREIKEPGLVKRDKQTREETKTEADSEFRKIFLKNAPETEKSEDGEWIKAEKGAWK
jgi:Asp-tRNA(Asn)/Glu-tRNA(Gln) amidotransferase C subunit